MDFVIFIALALALLFAASRLFMLTQATVGVGLLTAACFLAIVVRLAQAAKYQKAAEENWRAQLQAIHAQIAESAPAATPTRSPTSASRSDRSASGPVLPPSLR